MLSSTLLICCVFLAGRNDAAPTTIQERSAMTKTRLDDLDASATGYTYNQQQGVPVYYVQYTNHGSGRHYYTPGTVHYVLNPSVAPVASAVPETTPILRPYATVVNVPHSNGQSHQETADDSDVRPLNHLAGHARPQPYASYYVSNTTEHKKQEKEETRDEDVGEVHNDEKNDDDEGDYEENDEKVHGDSDGGVLNHGGDESGDERSSEAEEGEKNESEKHSKHEEKEKTGYKKSKENSKSKHSTNDEEKEQGYYDTKDERKKERIDEARKHGSHEEAEKSGKSKDYGHSTSYKKGYKTSGYHNVFHKDEYKNETDFYDEDHEKGHFDKHEESDKGYKVADGDFKKGGHHSSEKDHKDRGKKGWYKKEHRDKEDQGHRVEEGKKSYYDNHEQHDAEEDSKLAKTHKFHKESKH